MILQRRCLIFTSKCLFCKGHRNIFRKNIDFAKEVLDFCRKTMILQRASVQFIEKTWFCIGGVQFFAASAQVQMIVETGGAKTQNCHCSPKQLFYHFHTIFIPFFYHFFFRSDFEIFWSLAAAGLTLVWCGRWGSRTSQCRKRVTQPNREITEQWFLCKKHAEKMLNLKSAKKNAKKMLCEPLLF